VEELAPPPPPAPVDAPPARSQPAPVAPRPAPAAPKQPAPTLEPTPIPSPTPLPTPATASGTQIGGLPAGLDVNPANGRVFIADGSGVVWANDPGRPNVFNRPITLGNLPVDLAVDASTGYVFVSARNESAVVVLDASGRRLASIPMPVAPGDVQVDSDLGLAYVVLPQAQSLAVVDGRGGRLLRTIDGLPQVTSLALDPVRHTLYASHLGGQLTVIDVPTSQVMARMTLTGVGLESVATSRGLAYAINTASHELAVVEPVSQSISRYPLAVEPAAVAASEDSGSVYVLASRPNTVTRIDPTDGSILGQVTLPDRGGRFGISGGDLAAFQGLRSRMVLDRADDSLYVTLPEAGSLSIVPNDLFPPLNRAIPWVQAPEDAPVVASIPGVIRPAAPPLPSQPAPVLQARAPAQTNSAADEEAN
jgi:DNA-binding beta-propeller fold protein YncE